jgi:hypothetical protein
VRQFGPKFIRSSISDAQCDYIIRIQNHLFDKPFNIPIDRMRSPDLQVNDFEVENAIYYWRRIKDGKGYVGRADMVRARSKKHLRDAMKKRIMNSTGDCGWSLNL